MSSDGLNVGQVFRELAEATLREDAATGTITSAQYEFALHRYDEGVKIEAYLQSRYAHAIPASARILDLGCGNGGILLPFAQQDHFFCTGLERELRADVREVIRGTSVTFNLVAADGDLLPFADNSFDVVLYVETIEHLRNPRRAGSEIVRVLRPGGLCYITTPSRVRFLFAPDPHYGVPCLLLLPDALQRRVYEWRYRKTYDVEHLFWSVAGIMHTLPGLQLVEITSRRFAGFLRRFDWDWMIAIKP
ncbi:MAG TPA: class I SAM-dependent methyltransferase [Thermoanaerobaculia bacterium]|nr:class I SAM-dependent methyltransferase [Thermoanaerobaculia bacterium]